MKSNYEKQALEARKIFLQYDRENLGEKFGLIRKDGYLFIDLLGESYRIALNTGEILQEQEGAWNVCLDFHRVMILYDILCYSAEHPQLSGEWKPLASLQVTGSNPSADPFTARTALSFSGRVPALKEACRRLNGEELSVPASADACYQIPVFPFFPLIFQFWDGDEEFAPKIMLLWDKNSLDYMHFETLFYVVGLLLERLQTLDQTNG